MPALSDRELLATVGESFLEKLRTNVHLTEVSGVELFLEKTGKILIFCGNIAKNFL